MDTSLERIIVKHDYSETHEVNSEIEKTESQISVIKFMLFYTLEVDRHHKLILLEGKFKQNK